MHPVLTLWSGGYFGDRVWRRVIVFCASGFGEICADFHCLVLNDKTT